MNNLLFELNLLCFPEPAFQALTFPARKNQTKDLLPIGVDTII